MSPPTPESRTRSSMPSPSITSSASNLLFPSDAPPSPAARGEPSDQHVFAARNEPREVRRAASDAERQLLWKCRKQAFGAVGRLAPSYCTQDGVVPRTKLPHILRVIQRIGEANQIRIANVFHAGDGN